MHFRKLGFTTQPIAMRAKLGSPSLATGVADPWGVKPASINCTR
jgi:hypothetical protein